MPKITRFTVGDKVAEGDGVHIHWLDDRGGRTNSGTYVRTGDTAASVAERLAQSASHYLPSHFQVAHDGASVVVITLDGAPSGQLVPEVRGRGDVGRGSTPLLQRDGLKG